jgi:glycosyltransferase involved in cell wall biosynthesis
MPLPPILFFTPDPPGAIWQDKPQIARRLARVTQVLYVGEEPYLAAWPGLAGVSQPALSHVADGLYTFRWSPLAPVTGAPLLGPLTAALRRRRLQSALRALAPPPLPIHHSPIPQLTISPTPIPPLPIHHSPIPQLTISPPPIPPLPIHHSPIPQLTISPTPIPPLTIHHSPIPQLTISPSPIPPPILWLFRPGQQHWIDQIHPRLVIYHVVDEYSAYPGLSPAQAQRQADLDRQLTARADLVFCTAQSLVDARLPLNPHTHYMPNAVDYEAFRRAIDATGLDTAAPTRPTGLDTAAPTRPTGLDTAAPTRPTQSTNLPIYPSPVLAVVGGINAKVDLALLAEVATRRPDWRIELIGPLGYGLDAEELARLRALPNVRLAGAVPPEQAPLAMAGCDVGLIPYKLNEQTRHVNPLKVYEYLAAGRPVVATPLPELRQFQPLVRLAGDVDGFIAAVEAALAEGDAPQAMAARLAMAAANSWDVRVERMVALVEGALGRLENG